MIMIIIFNMNIIIYLIIQYNLVETGIVSSAVDPFSTFVTLIHFANRTCAINFQPFRNAIWMILMFTK